MAKPKKYWAYYLKNNVYKKINASQVLIYEKKEPGRWRRQEYFSTHSIDDRLKMHHKVSHRLNCFFAYNPGQDDALERLGGGESLSHYLFKQAISELEQTTLSIKKYEVEIKIRNVCGCSTEEFRDLW